MAITRGKQNGSHVVKPSHGKGMIRTGGNPGNKGGRSYPKQWLEFCEMAVNDPKVQAVALKAMRSERDKSRVANLGLAAAYAVGKPVERVVHSGSVERVLRVIREPMPPLPQRSAYPVAVVVTVEAER